MSDTPRPATGPMRFFCDGVGIFLRGEKAADYARALALTIDPNASAAMREHAAVTVRDLMRLLQRANPLRRDDDDVQVMRPFDDCTEDAA